MDINQKLLERRKAIKKSRLNRILKVKKKFHTAQKFIDKELEEKLHHDPLADKKHDFYNKLFSGEIQEDVPEVAPRRFKPRRHEAVEEPTTIEPPQQLRDPARKGRNYKCQSTQPKIVIQEPIEPIVAKAPSKTKREQGLAKKIFKERTKSGQPVMKNLINYIVYKLDKEKKSQ